MFCNKGLNVDALNSRRLDFLSFLLPLWLINLINGFLTDKNRTLMLFRNQRI